MHRYRVFAFASVVLTAVTLLPIAAAEDQFFLSDGVKIQYVDQGQGEPVVLIHGFSANYLANWVMPGVVKAIGSDYRIIGLDNRGHGKSGKPHDAKKYGIEMVNDIVRLLDHLEIDKAHIVGYSMGGFITNKFRSVHPERCITATLGGAGWSEPESPTQALMEQLADSLERGDGIGPLIVALTPADAPAPTEQQIQASNNLVMAMNDPKALAAVIRGMEALEISKADLEKNKVPTLALIGERDPLKSGVDLLAEVMPGLDVVVIPGADHMSATGDSTFSDSLKRFLNEHASTVVGD